MNKIHFLGLLFPLALFSACEDGVQPEQPGKVYEITSFAASTEVEDDARTSLTYKYDGGTTSKPVVIWQDKDEVTLLSSDGNSATFKTTVKSGTYTKWTTFVGQLASSSSPFYAVYPSSLGATLADGKLQFTLPQIQPAAISASNGVMPSIACFTDASELIVFKNFCSMLRVFMPSGENYISKIELYDLGGDMLWGDVSLTANADVSNPATWNYTLSGGNNCLVLNFATPRKLDNENYYYFVVPPGKLSNGIRLIAYDGSGNPIDEFCAGGDMSAPRSHIKPMSNVTIGNYVLLDVKKDEEVTNVENWANCYYIADYSNTTATYKFCAMAGNSGAMVRASSAEVLWETYNNSSPVTVNSVVDNVGLSAGCVTFQAGGTAGNAGIAVKNSSDDITWSWHIWLPSSTVEALDRGSSPKLMDRNLGALLPSRADGVATIGLYYQWGRKDPFPSSASFSSNTYITIAGNAFSNVARTADNGNVAYVIAHPQDYLYVSGEVSDSERDWVYGHDGTLWAAQKTRYDPCPPGWHVPPYTDWWKGNPGTTWYHTAPYGIDIQYYSTNTTWFPAGGFRYASNGSIHDSGSNAYYWGYETSAEDDRSYSVRIKLSDETRSPQRIARGCGVNVRCISE